MGVTLWSMYIYIYNSSPWNHNNTAESVPMSSSSIFLALGIQTGEGVVYYPQPFVPPCTAWKTPTYEPVQSVSRGLLVSYPYMSLTIDSKSRRQPSPQDFPPCSPAFLTESLFGNYRNTRYGSRTTAARVQTLSFACFCR